MRFGTIGPCQDQEKSARRLRFGLGRVAHCNHCSSDSVNSISNLSTQGSPVAFSRNSVSARSSTCANRSRPCKVPSVEQSSLHHGGGGPSARSEPVKRRVCPSQPPLTGALACVRERLDNGCTQLVGQQKFLVVVPRAGIERPHQHVTSVLGGSTFPQLPYELLIFSVPAL